MSAFIDAVVIFMAAIFIVVNIALLVCAVLLAFSCAQEGTKEAKSLVVGPLAMAIVCWVYLMQFQIPFLESFLSLKLDIAVRAAWLNIEVGACLLIVGMILLCWLADWDSD